MNTPTDNFKERVALFGERGQYYNIRYQWLSWARIFVFTLGIILTWYLFSQDRNEIGFLVLLGFIGAFTVLMRVHNRIGYTRDHHRFLAQLNQQEIRRGTGHLADFDPGNKYRDARHPYTADLDIFGTNSVYQFVNRATTALGQNVLADWLRVAALPAEIRRRQEVLAELTPELDWRQHFQARAMHYTQEVQEPIKFFDWLRAPDFFADKVWLKVATFLLPLLTIGAWVWWAMGTEGSYIWVPLSLMLLQGYLGYQYNAERDAYYAYSNGMYDVLRSYTSLLQHLEEKIFKAPMALDLQAKLQVEGKPASSRLQELATIVEYLSARLNVTVSVFLNTILMWDFFWMYRIEGWKKRMAVNLEPVLEALAQFEALASFAAYQYANPDYALPTLREEPFTVEAEGMGHPLILAGERITNDFAMSGAGKTAVITGSNMSGKSTFLRTLGVNMVLAQAGAPVCARQFRIYPMQVFTGMRTEDNLAEHTSSFYAELKRIKQLLDLTATGVPVFYFLDEILKGTNSRDRHLGAVALIRQMHRRQSSGLISTHDLELGRIQVEMPGHIRNYSFNSTIEGEVILFDYKLHEGVCHSFNASKLMQQIGIEMEPDQDV